MWPFPRRTSRRQEIRRDKVVREGRWFRRLFTTSLLAGLGLTIVLATIVASVLTLGRDALDLRVGQHVERGITARVDFSIVDQQKTTEMRIRARDTAPSHYRLDTILLGELEAKLTAMLTLARSADAPAEVIKLAAEQRLVLDEAAVAEIRRLDEAGDGEQFTRTITAYIRALRGKPIVDRASIETRTPSKIVLIDPGQARERSLPPEQLVFVSDESAVRSAIADAATVFREPLRPSMQSSVLRLLEGPSADESGPTRPLYVFDTDATASAADAAVAAVEVQRLTYRVGDVLADAGVISSDELELLRAEQESLRAVNEADLRAWGKRAAGRTGLVFLVIFGIVGYMAHYRPDPRSTSVRRVLSAVVLVIVLGLTRLLYTSTELPPAIAFAGQAFAAALLGIVYAHGLVLTVCVGLAMLMTLAVDQGVGFLVALIAMSGALIFGLRDLRRRGQVVAVSFVAAVVGAVGLFCVGLLNAQTARFALQDAAWALGLILLAGFVVEGILPGIERLFRLSTGMTLLEWCDASRRLLRRMAADAPGTYNHSLLVAALCENAAEAIGANALLARAGALYHDIGKINKPEYFIENQSVGSSRHDRLTPAMSHLIIIGHVKDGIEMAREYNLPASLLPFIAEHHGTTLVAYFYHAAKGQRGPHDPEVSDSEFRYPGPKPQSRETALLMLCDGVEGAVRAMPEPTPGRIEAVVSKITTQRLNDGQFDECDLTFRELAIIERSLVKSLCGIYHARIAYPKAETATASGA